MLNNFQGNVLTLGTIASVVNIVAQGVMMKEEPIIISHKLKFYVLIAESSFIDLCDSSYDDKHSFLDVVVLVFVNSQAVEKQLLRMNVP